MVPGLSDFGNKPEDVHLQVGREAGESGGGAEGELRMKRKGSHMNNRPWP
jgi:hypothetical protein